MFSDTNKNNCSFATHMPQKMYRSDVTEQDYTAEEFLRMAQKRLRKQLRQTKELDVRKRYAIIKEHSGDALLLLDLLKKIFDGRLDVDVADSEDVNRIPLLARPLETHAKRGLDYFIKHKDLNELEDARANPLRHFTIHECKQLASLLGIEGEMSESTNEMFEAMHEDYPQTKSSLLKSIDEIKRQLE
ncbi:MAG: hypothetical protein ACQESE_00210 [Nanobdellota archaeon]